MTVPAERAQWTVGQLRAELVGIPDDTPLAVDVHTADTMTRRHPITGAGFGPALYPDEGIFAGQEFSLLAGPRPLPDRDEDHAR